MLTIPDFACKASLNEWLAAHKSLLIAQKKSEIKYADAVNSHSRFILDDDKTEVTKAEQIPASVSKIKVRSIINTTKLFDSHEDVHIDQLWNKNLKESREHYLCKEHNFRFDGIITDNVHAFVKQMSWYDLGYNYEGNTQALVFDSIIDKEEMPAATASMFDKYRKGQIKQHSVGMRYVTLFFALNDDRYKEDFEVWEKFFPDIANKEDALDNGYFFAVTAAKVIEGSAVVRGANFATPTIHVEPKSEPPNSIREEPPKSIRASDLIKFYKP